MKNYASKAELRATIQKSLEKYLGEFEQIPESLKDKRCEGESRSPAENLAYQLGWTGLLLSWERAEREGLEPKTPCEGFGWNELGKLYELFNKTYAHLSIKDLKKALEKNINELYKMLDLMSEEELFVPHKRRWADEATRTASWPVWKFIHINTVAPFGSFRTKIRKWKRAVLGG